MLTWGKANIDNRNGEQNIFLLDLPKTLEIFWKYLLLESFNRNAVDLSVLSVPTQKFNFRGEWNIAYIHNNEKNIT